VRRFLVKPLLPRIMELLESVRGDRYCSASLSNLFQAPKSTVHETIIALDGRLRFARRYGLCTSCGKTRIVVYAEPTTSTEA